MNKQAIEKLRVSPLTFDYFATQGKAGTTEEDVIMKISREVFDEIFVSNFSIYQSKLKPISREINESNYPLIAEIQNKLKTSSKNDVENCKCDEAFSEYLIKVSKHTCKEYFAHVVKFVFLYREHLNLYHLTTHKIKDYSIISLTEDAPDVANEFITDFLDTESRSFGFSYEESCELTQNLCQWMYDSNYTCSKLTMMT